MIPCDHPAEALGWLPSGDWGCKVCGWIAPLSAVKAAWHIRHPNLTSAIIGSLAAAIGITCVILVCKWIG